MSFDVEIDLHGLNVLIIGGGEVALRKANLCKKEGAKVTLLSQQFQDAITTSSFTLRMHPYTPDILDHYSLIIVATNDKEFQQQVIADARAKHRLCMGVHGDDQAPLHAMVSKDYGSFQLALSTHGNFPAMAKKMVNKAGDMLYEQEHERLALLSEVRKKLSFIHVAKIRQDICRHLANADMRYIKEFQQLLDHKIIHVFCFHGVKQFDVLTEMDAFMRKVQEQLPNVATICTYLSTAVVKEVNTNECKVFALNELMYYSDLLKDRQIIIHPMLFQEGRYFEQIRKFASSRVAIKKPLFTTLEEVEELLTRINQNHHKVDTILIRYHSSQDGMLATYFKTLAPSFPRIAFANERVQPQDINIVGKDVLLYPLYMLKGMHMRHDIEEEGSFIPYFKKRGLHFECIDQSAIGISEIQELLLKKL